MKQLRDYFFDWRNQTIASPRFQRWSARFPLTRGIVRKQAAALFDLMAGFVYSQVLLACVQVNIFEVLSQGAKSFRDLCAEIPLPEAGLRRLLDAAVALNLLTRRGTDRYALGMLGAPLVGNEALMNMIKHHIDLYHDLADPLALLRGDNQSAAMAGYWPYVSQDQNLAPEKLRADQVQAYSTLMSQTQPLVSAEVLEAYSFAQHKNLLDIGGGEGKFALDLAQQYPNLQITLFDIPAVAALANAQFKQRQFGSRTQAIGGNFFDPLPQGADIATLIRVIFDHDDTRVKQLLANIYDALIPGGALLLAEPMAGTPGQLKMGDAYFGFYLLAMGRGRPRSQGEIKNLLAEAGFEAIRLLPSAIPLNAQILHCTKPQKP
ncbi:acetylserotonin O-methyltransferase [Polynucleobacter sp. IMCC 30228]|uniref:acetylserotonin O-methyltransferase n=1 Tax=Polynucleobacter sp. IMCC 30228 TaxID=2781011 RepID=UPI001F3D559C|nr:acetylserotonin O-methyltransferase [Polynucleobacter sp. IMCC 30228]MCE7526132.1 acetylserotonin O-methyltransferase [Polynucleobacter sp. IMCC 30228]